MDRSLAIVVVVAVVAGVIALGVVPIVGRWETTPLRRGATWVGLVGMVVAGVVAVVWIATA